MQACRRPRAVCGFQSLYSVLTVALLAPGSLQESVGVQPNAVTISDGTELLAALNDTQIESIVLKGWSRVLRVPASWKASWCMSSLRRP